MNAPARTFSLTLAALLALAAASGCDRASPSAAESTPAPPKRNLWQPGELTPIVRLAEDADAELQAAMQQARETAEKARAKWLNTPPDQLDRWAVKWAAPTTTGSAEYVWVRPVEWSRFRIEGRLASKPIAALEAGKTLGDLVSFPVEDLADWILLKPRISDDHETHRRVENTDPASDILEGGFTLRVLEERFGTPR